MSFFVEVDASKEKFDDCCIEDQGEKIFSLICSMDREEFEKFIHHLPTEKSVLLLGMESTASCHLKIPFCVPYDQNLHYRCLLP